MAFGKPIYFIFKKQIILVTAEVFFQANLFVIFDIIKIIIKMSATGVDAILYFGHNTVFFFPDMPVCVG